MKNLNLIRGSVIGTLALGALFLSGCLTGEGNSNKADGSAQLSIVTSVRNVNDRSLGKAATITLKKMIITLTSSVGTDSVIRDTVVAGGADLSTRSDTAQTVVRSYTVKAQRNWTVNVKTYDLLDSVVHNATAHADSIKTGQTKPVILNLSSRYVTYIAKFTVPDSLRSLSGGSARLVTIDEIKMIVDSSTVRDSSRAPSVFKPSTHDSTFTHTVGYDYISTASLHNVKLQFIGKVAGGSANDTVIFEYTHNNVNPATDSTITGTANVVIPGGPGLVGLTVNIAKVGVVVLDITPGQAPKAAANKDR